jgi:hypothetical protein
LVAGTTYSRARDTLARCLPLLDGFRPLPMEAENDYADALRNVVRFQIVELVSEFGSLGGPSVAHVDHLFTLLLGHRLRTAADEVGGLIGELGTRLGLARELVNSVAEEQDATNFRILTDYITSVQRTWSARQIPR